MAERRHERAADIVEREQQVAEVRTAIQFLVKGIDRLEGSLDRLQQTVREDFASTGDLEIVKAAVTQLRIDLDRRLSEVERGRVADQQAMQAHVDERVKRMSARNERDIKIAKWLIRVAIPAGLLAVGTLAWKVFSAYVQHVVTKP